MRTESCSMSKKNFIFLDKVRKFFDSVEKCSYCIMYSAQFMCDMFSSKHYVINCGVWALNDFLFL